ncbi:hypothetical protein MCOR07_000660 [Pyricularia oryzae]|uniref:Acid phosphatase n=1 Tax=Pyricularia grisea TaxID=148305 RepID=A0ABQ8NE30_PYRGI|nr:hypothetical protein MCOR01_007550 [Pyricularia oryzae]KAI6295543.1 hypothetical protein MCOR33_007562 [Pyricularia grisea]KAI6284868.1 hypothetical protein MCOR26_001764 [Pyricularia oryzae]KAI6305162.1 hypothetical protein MCOR29_010602 [Pyricularia oryzae]KAI6314602.1 hypothetical protein MCOR34_004889 [Pyricularia oryzae]
MRLYVAATALASLLAPATADRTGPPVVEKGRPAQKEISPSLQEIIATQAIAKVSSPTSDVKGVAFDRIVQIWLENTNFQAAAGDENFKWVASQGILLENYFAVTHPSQPNYAASISGDTFGLESGDFYRFPENISTVVDLLDTKKISWGAYQEDMPYAGFQGFNFSNQKTFANAYMRKHNPLILFDNIANNPDRASQIKNFTSFEEDLEKKQLPQWSFITPNTDDGHDSNYKVAARWTKSFLEPLLKNEYFMNRTLIILTFDESEVYTIQNRVFTVLMGGAVDEKLRGTNDSMFYNHYSTLATVSANWGLPSLGRWDCGSNILSMVANKTGYKNVMPDLPKLFFNETYPGPASQKRYTPGWWPVPDTTSSCSHGNGVLASVKDTWKNLPGPAYNYSDAFPYDQRTNLNTAAPAIKGSMSVVGPVAEGSSGSSSGQKKNGGASSAVGRTTVCLGASALLLTLIF